ncbi:3-oxo-5-alpha-steroid 4-dehydrogenase 2-like [Benincasa hispida]|uniref:3-oxo-5-alpha-steroid 4-dehydrogenase 2-like n=1 Tax=Benincasa hispida TaxID=102211 RepID=UPI0019029A54|nr:3-oxo-5-alpha-steroid 4-dehydrogenase 2-like [Benincasa hispida]
MDTVSEFFFPPPSSLFVNVMTVVSSAVVVVVGLSETRGKNMKYSKFWNNTNNAPKSSNLSARLGMLLAYMPAFLVGVVLLWLFPNEDRRILLLKSALILHFFKRNLEVLFLHKYSSKMVIDTVITISLSYFSSTAIMIYTQHLSQGLPEPSIDLKKIGIALYLIGITGNFYHHYLLSKARKQGETSYKIPKGGLFSFIICPHYLFEIIEFFGFAFISQTIYSLFFAIATALYLTGRSYATRKWYVSKFEDFPSHVKALLPFLF